MSENCNCQDLKHTCGEFKGNESKEEKLKHLKNCRESFQKRLEDIDNAIKKIRS
ncbi:MAG: hypothetical protein U9O98_03720 [Asgard group archaeon]|nr:hypothetical protein [Asgard group archaeon]